MPKIHEEVLCCGYKRCPTVKVFEDGSMELTDDDSSKGSVGTIKLEADQVARLVEIATKKAG